MDTLDGKVALVTGSSRGIVAAIARLFAAHGAKVAVRTATRSPLPRIEGASWVTGIIVDVAGGATMVR